MRSATVRDSVKFGQWCGMASLGMPLKLSIGYQNPFMVAVNLGKPI